MSTHNLGTDSKVVSDWNFEDKKAYEILCVAILAGLMSCMKWREMLHRLDQYAAGLHFESGALKIFVRCYLG